MDTWSQLVQIVLGVYGSTLSGGALGSLASSLAKLFRAEEWNERTLPNHAIASAAPNARRKSLLLRGFIPINAHHSQRSLHAII